MLATVPSAVVDGVRGRSVRVEVMHTGRGAPGFTIVGLPDATIRESRDRVRAALVSSGLTWPATLPLIVNLAPTDVRKHGAGFDLPLALGVLAASKQVPLASLDGVAAVGELGLDGSIRPVPGLVSLAEAMPGDRLVVPASGASEAAIVAPGRAVGFGGLRELVDVLKGERPYPPPAVAPPAATGSLDLHRLADVRGQETVRRALIVAAAGGHHLLMVGPPGAGKTMLATRLPGLLPPLADDEALEVARIHSVAGLRDAAAGLDHRPPFRAPHHNMSMVGLVGGGTRSVRPGEISASHGGVLFLDELGEFPPRVLDALRQPLEEGVIRISRAHGSWLLPARFQLVAASNPCPCGEGWRGGACRCSETMHRRYAKRLSGPLLDRFDLRVEVAPPDPIALLDAPAVIDDRAADEVARVRAVAESRGVRSNSAIPADRLDELAPLSPHCRPLVERALRDGRLTARGLARVRRVARTLADLDGSATIEPAHLRVGLHLRLPVGELLPAAA